MKKHKVYVISSEAAYVSMYLFEGWEITQSLKEADLVQFTGGADVSPIIYGQNHHTTTISNPERDERENLIYKFCDLNKIPMVGICRGGQFLNVMCGGDMWQNVDGHCKGKHEAIDEKWGDVLEVSSTHHQMMIPTEGADILLTASESTRRERFMRQPNRKVDTLSPQTPILMKCKTPFVDDVEACLYRTSYNRVLCFQPHPEYQVYDKCRSLFFKLLNEFVMEKD